MADEFLDPGRSGREPAPTLVPGRDVRGEWPAWILLAVLWGASLWAVGHLPDRVPLHWDLRGQVDRWGSPLQAALLVPGIATGAYLLILAFDWGRLDFQAARAMAPATTRRVRILILLLMGALHGTILWTSMRGGVAAASRLMLILALFLIFLGDLFPRLEPNAWVGIRVPPTLENREVWKRTHRMGGRWLVLAGLAGLPLSLLPERFAVLGLFPLLLPLAAATVYAYMLRARLARRDPDSQEHP